MLLQSTETGDLPSEHQQVGQIPLPHGLDLEGLKGYRIELYGVRHQRTVWHRAGSRLEQC